MVPAEMHGKPLARPSVYTWKACLVIGECIPKDNRVSDESANCESKFGRHLSDFLSGAQNPHRIFMRGEQLFFR